MKTNQDFYAVDKAASEEILKEFRGEVIDVDCPYCKNEKPENCIECEGKGSLQYEV